MTEERQLGQLQRGEEHGESKGYSSRSWDRVAEALKPVPDAWLEKCTQPTQGYGISRFLETHAADP